MNCWNCFICLTGFTSIPITEGIYLIHVNYPSTRKEIATCEKCWNKATDSSEICRIFTADEWIGFAGSEWEPIFDADFGQCIARKYYQDDYDD